MSSKPSISLIVLMLLLTKFVICQFEGDYFVFTARLICRIPEKQAFRFRIQYWEDDFTNYHDKLTRFDNIGSATNGEALVNNFAKMYGDSFHPLAYWHGYFGSYEPYAIIHHDCVKGVKMKKITRYLDDCLIMERNCNRKMHLDLTEMGDDVDVEPVMNATFSF